MGTLMMYLRYPFVRYALIVGVLVALCAALLGVPLVLKRFSFIGDGLSHVAFGAMCIASVMKLTNNMVFALPVTAAGAVLILRTGTNTKIKGDAMIAMISTASLALGYLLMNLSDITNVSGDVCSALFGSASILTLTRTEVIACIVLSAVVIFCFVRYYNRIFAVTFDETFARAVGTDTDRYGLFLAVITAVIIVLAMNLVGSLLISALIIFPPISAMRLYHNYKAVTICAAVLSACSALAGMIVSLLAGTPAGPTVVMADLLVFVVCWLIGRTAGH